MKWQKADVRLLYHPTTGVMLRAKPGVKTSKQPIWEDSSAATSNKRKKHDGMCIMFEGLRYQTLSSFAKDHGFDSGAKKNIKMKWYKLQLSKRPLKDRLRFLPSSSLTSISRMVPERIRKGLKDAKNMTELFVPAIRRRNTGNANLFKLTVLG